MLFYFQHKLSDSTKVYLKNISLKASGLYRCEVSAGIINTLKGLYMNNSFYAFVFSFLYVDHNSFIFFTEAPSFSSVQGEGHMQVVCK